jgi:hypothetical protein
VNELLSGPASASPLSVWPLSAPASPVPASPVPATHCDVAVSQTGVLEFAQSALTRHPPTGLHFPVVLHEPDWHTEAVVDVQGPSPFA